MLEVVAALICREDRFLACQRPQNKARGLQWEFVGGKVEQNESLAQALVRECREELDITVSAEAVVTDLIYTYPDVAVHLTLMRATLLHGEPTLLEHRAFKWMTLAEAADYDFCPADRIFLERLEDLW